MNRPSLTVRLAGSPRIACALFFGYAAVVAGWYEGRVSWWIGVAAIAAAGRTLSAVKRVRLYKTWLADWQGMGAAGVASPQPASKPHTRGRKASSPWVGVIVAAVSLVMIPVVIAASGANESLRQALTLLWFGTAVYLLWKLAAKLWRTLFRAAGTASAGERKNGAPTDVVEWALPRASSSPSRADAMRNLPEYSARLIDK